MNTYNAVCQILMAVINKKETETECLGLNFKKKGQSEKCVFKKKSEESEEENHVG
jgi:hypothetical protein